MLDDRSTAVLEGRARSSTFAAGATILEQGEPCSRVGTLVRGTVKVVHLTEDGDEQVLQLRRPGDLIGDPFGEESGVGWQAATDVTMCWLPRASLDGVFREVPMLYRAFLAGAVRELQDQRLWAAALRGRSTVQRLAYWLARQPVAASDSGAVIVEIELSRRDLASLLDMSVETLCRSLHQIEQRGAIRLLAPHMMAVTDPAALRRLSSVEEELAAPRIRAPKAARRDKAFLYIAADPGSPKGASGTGAPRRSR